MTTSTISRPRFKSKSTVVYLIAIVVFQVDFFFLLSRQLPDGRRYGGQFQYLTNLGVTASYLTVILGFFANLTGSIELLLVKNRILLVSCPVEVLISVLYGGLCLIDRSLVVPNDLTVFLPVYIDFGLHGFPAIALLIDYLAYSPNWEINNINAFTIYATAGVGYWLWVHEVYRHNKVFPYPLLDLTTKYQRATIFIASILVLFVVFFLLRQVHEFLRLARKPTLESKKVD
ncbi:FAR-17a/AIG1-like protein [Lipomyces japonicus]|uniref:FAR-17a/AIG1-like protein n=1 Tax=Lipomyces japonicus TaxID=56871 RepID=UPI0034CDD2F3